MDFSLSRNPFWEKAIPCHLNFVRKDLKSGIKKFLWSGLFVYETSNWMYRWTLITGREWTKELRTKGKEERKEIKRPFLNWTRAELWWIVSKQVSRQNKIRKGEMDRSACGSTVVAIEKKFGCYLPQYGRWSGTFKNCRTNPVTVRAQNQNQPNHSKNQYQPSHS